MERLASAIIGRSLAMLRRGGLFFIAVYLLTAIVFVAVDPYSVGTCAILVISGLMGLLFWVRVKSWQHRWARLADPPKSPSGGREPPHV